MKKFSRPEINVPMYHTEKGISSQVPSLVPALHELADSEMCRYCDISPCKLPIPTNAFSEIIDDAKIVHNTCDCTSALVALMHSIERNKRGNCM